MSDPVRIFDDVAFYWFLQVILGIVLFPITLYKIKRWRGSNQTLNATCSHPTVKSIPDYVPKHKALSYNESRTNTMLSLKNICFTFLWTLFILVLIQSPRWNHSKITTFDPWDTLHLSKTAPRDEYLIKKAYKTMAKMYHPDICTKPPLQWTEKKCSKHFILVHKAYEILKDEEAMRKWENGMDPDAQNAIVMTIGLPSWLLDHPLVVLLVYLSGLIVLLLVVRFWWQHSSQFHRSGVKKKSIAIFWRFIKQNMRSRHLLELLAASREYTTLDVSIPNDDTNEKYQDFKSLEREIVHMRKDRKMSTNRIFNIPYVRKCTVLLTAHLLMMPIAASLHSEYLFALHNAPRLIDVMIDVTLSRQNYWMQTLQLIQLKQAIFQGVWPNESVLKQLPNWTPSVDKAIRKKGYHDIVALNYLKNDSLKSLLSPIYSENDDVMENAVACIRMYPCVKMTYCARTYGETQVFNDDIVTVTVYLDRIEEPWALDRWTFEDISKMKPPERCERGKDEDCNDAAVTGKFELSGTCGPIVHLNRFPFRVNEKWLVILIDKDSKTVLDYKAISDFNDSQKINLYFKANKPRTGNYPYVLMAICDSYLGAEKQVEFKIHIKCEQRVFNDDDYYGKLADDKEMADHDVETKVDIKWYYLWNASFWECLLTLALLYFIYLVVIESRFGKRYLEPYVNYVSGLIEPCWRLVVRNLDQFIVKPITDQLFKETGFDIIEWVFGKVDDDIDKEYFEHAQSEYQNMDDAKDAWDDVF
eukprot:219879_1